MCIDHLPDGRLLIVDSSERRTPAPGRRRVPCNPRRPRTRRAPLERHRRGRARQRLCQQHRLRLPGRGVRARIVALVTPDGSARQVADGLAFPNGMAVTPDNATLIVAESYGNKLTAFDIAADGSLSNRRMWAEVADHPDGICLDAEGAIWYGDVAQQALRARARGRRGAASDRPRSRLLRAACSAGRTGERCSWSPTSGATPRIERWAGQGQVLSIEVVMPGIGWP